MPTVALHRSVASTYATGTTKRRTWNGFNDSSRSTGTDEAHAAYPKHNSPMASQHTPMTLELGDGQDRVDVDLVAVRTQAVQVRGVDVRLRLLGRVQGPVRFEDERCFLRRAGVEHLEVRLQEGPGAHTAFRSSSAVQTW